MDRIATPISPPRILLQGSNAGSPAVKSLRELAARKLPEVDGLITRAQASLQRL